MSETRCDFLYLSEHDMIDAGVTDMAEDLWQENGFLTLI